MRASLLPALLLGAGLLAACAPGRPAPAPVGAPASLAPEDRLVAAIEAEGCVLTRDNVGAVLLRANLRQDQLPAATRNLQAAGRIEAPTGDTIRVLSDDCI